MVKAKEVISNKFWIVENDGINVGVLRSENDRFILSTDTEETTYSKSDLSTTFGSQFFTTDAFITKPLMFEVHGYKTSHEPFNAMYDIRRKLPIYNKGVKSPVKYCAGYYLIRFNTRWAKKFCPKLTTLNKYTYEGPFKSSSEQDEAYLNASRQNKHE